MCWPIYKIVMFMIAFIACADGLKGFPDAIQSVFLNTIVQPCTVVHQTRNPF